MEQYQFIVEHPGNLKESALRECLQLIKDGAAVDLGSATREIPLARAVAFAFDGNVVVGVGVIKRDRPRYAKEIEKKSGVSSPVNGFELGYVAVKTSHRGQGISGRLISKLLDAISEPLFATTDSDHMKRALLKAGFVKSGTDWQGKRGKLSLWIRSA